MHFHKKRELNNKRLKARKGEQKNVIYLKLTICHRGYRILNSRKNSLDCICRKKQEKKLSTNNVLLKVHLDLTMLMSKTDDRASWFEMRLHFIIMW